VEEQRGEALERWWRSSDERAGHGAARRSTSLLHVSSDGACAWCCAEGGTGGAAGARTQEKRKAAAGRLDVAVAACRTDGRGSAAVEAHQTSGRGGVGSPDGRTRRWRRLSGRPDAVTSQWSSWCWCGTPWREGRPQQSGAKDLLRLVEVSHASDFLTRETCTCGCGDWFLDLI
jgi:hypothetical protein